MRVLFVSTHINPLNPPDCGDAQRTRLLLQACARMGEVDLLTFAGKSNHQMEGVNVVYDERKRQQGARQSRFSKWTDVSCFTGKDALFPIDKGFESVVDEIVNSNDYDLIVSRYFHRTLLCGLWKYHEKLVVDFDDAPSSLFLNQIVEGATLSFKIRMHLASRKAVQVCRKAIKDMRASFFADQAQAIAYRANYLPNIPYIEGCGSDPDFRALNRRILFVGQLDYLPNRNGLDHFLEKVYLPLCEKHPEIDMHIVGSLSDENVRNRWQRYPRVKLMGFVDDLIGEYEQAHLAVVPIYQCGGTNIKLLEAMKMKRACVTTKEVIEKLGWQEFNGKSFYAASNDEEFLRYVELMLTNDDANAEVANQGHRLIGEYYSFDSFCRIFQSCLN